MCISLPGVTISVIRDRWQFGGTQGRRLSGHMRSPRKSREDVGESKRRAVTSGRRRWLKAGSLRYEKGGVREGVRGVRELKGQTIF